ncbi:MAG: DUF1398 family protein [Bacteroidetes bacterium]|nr:DUF1398 family protein [Bacteroidota bacterium]
MFTVEQIKAAHSKVKSGADFPAYIQDIKKLGVTFYETYVIDGHTDYFGANNYKTTAPGKYDKRIIAETSNTNQFKIDLKEHQQGKTDFLTFIPRFRAPQTVCGYIKFVSSNKHLPAGRQVCTKFPPIAKHRNVGRNLKQNT